MKFTNVLQKAILTTVAVATVAFGFSLSQGSAAAATPKTSMAPMSPLKMAASWQAPRLTKLAAAAVHQTTTGAMYASGGGHGSSPAPLGSNVDCSGFVREMYGYAFNTDIGNGSGDSIVRLSGNFVRTSHPVPGDVALFGNGGQAPAYHAGIYIGIINGHPAAAAASETGKPIRIQQWYNRYWAADLMGYWHYRGATPADSGPLVQPKMLGNFDSASGVPGGFRLSGWSVDPQNNTASGSISVIADNNLVAHLRTPIVRTDVNDNLRTSGAHGFSTAIPFPAGRHVICLVATSAGTSSAASNLGCIGITVPRPTIGKTEKAVGGHRDFIVTGWAFDPSTPSASSYIRVSDNGRAILDVRASGTRADVNRGLRVGGNHGFVVRLGATPGRHTICVAALRTSRASYQTAIGCKVVTVRS